ncbi:MAG: ABC transporter permease, partial [Actinomycetota bacterium]
MSAPAPGPIKAAPADFGSTEPTRWNSALQRIATGNGMISVLSVILALVAGSIMIAFTDSEVQRTAGYFFARPGDMLLAV